VFAFVLGTYANNGEDIWTGGTNFQSNGFYWDMSGRPFGEGPMNWSPGMPSNGRDFSCVAMSAGLNQEWIDADCDQKKLFVCEYIQCQKNKEDDQALSKHQEGLHMHQKN
jgi:Lectin C-type domain